MKRFRRSIPTFIWRWKAFWQLLSVSEDPIRPEAPAVIRALKDAGISKVVMMTGDSERTARAVAAKVGVDEFFAEVLPEDKARFVEEEKAKGTQES